MFGIRKINESMSTSVMYVCLTDSAGEVLVHKNLGTTPEALMRVIEPYREDLAIAVECVFVRAPAASDRCARGDVDTYKL